MNIYGIWLILFYLIEFVMTNDVRLFKKDASFSAWIQRHQISDKRFIAVYGPVTFLAYSFGCWLAFHVFTAYFLWQNEKMCMGTVTFLLIWWVNAGPTIINAIILAVCFIGAYLFWSVA